MKADSECFREAVDKSNAANDAKRASRYDEAIRLHTEALEARIRLHGERSIQAAISFNDLGETFLAAGRLNEAADALTKALVVRDDKEFGGMELGPRNDGAASRDNMARVLEARGNFPGAREMRIKGADKGRTLCGCDYVSTSLREFGQGFCENSAKCFLLVNYSACALEAPCFSARS